MDVIYKIGVIIGIIAIYTLVTMGLGMLFTAFSSSQNDVENLICSSWGIGLIAFIVLAIFTLTKFNLWGGV